MNAITEKGRLLTDEERLDPAHTALVLIDIQNDFCHPDALFGKLGNDLSMMPAMAEHTRALLQAARRKGMLILFVRATYDDEVLSAPLAETYHRRGFVDGQCLEGSSGADWYGGLGPNPAAPNEVVVTKHRFSAFWGSDFDLYLRANQIRTLVFAGVVTSGCVESTLRDAFFRDYYVVCASDCVAEASPARHGAALHKIDQAFGAVRDASNIAAIWDHSASTVPAFTAAAKLGRALSDFPARIHPAHSALLLIDLQRDFCSVDGAIGRSGRDLTAVTTALKQASKLLTAARTAGMQVIHVRSEYSDVAASEVSLVRSRGAADCACCQPSTAGAAFMPEVAPRAGEWVVTKHRSSGFVDTRLELLLRSNGIRTLIMPAFPRPAPLNRPFATHRCATTTSSLRVTPWRRPPSSCTCTAHRSKRCRSTSPTAGQRPRSSRHCRQKKRPQRKRVNGVCSPRFAEVRNAFAQNFAEHGECGAAVAVWHDGALAVDLWGGHADAAGTRPWQSDMLVCCMSVSKAVTAIACAKLLELGLDYSAPVARYWPEFAHEGKGGIEVGWCLDHRAGLPWLAREPAADAYADWEWVTRALASQAPVTQPGVWRGYHVVTMGYLAGELVRRVTGMSVGRFVVQTIGPATGAEFHIGLDSAHDSRCAEFHGNLEGSLLRPADPASMQGRCVALLRSVDFNSRRFRGAEIPSINGHCTARDAARLFGRMAEIHAGDSTGPVAPDSLREATRLRWSGEEHIMGHTRCFGAGFALGTPRFSGAASPKDFTNF